MNQRNATVQLTTAEADDAWLVVDNWREPQQNRLAAVLELIGWMNKTGECPHSSGYRIVTEVDVLWICTHVLATEVERTNKETP